MLKQSAHIKSPDIPVSSFEEYFKAVNNSEDPFFQVDEDSVHFNIRDEFQVMFHELDTDVSLEEINKGIKQLKLSKSAGPDNYLNEYFIHGNTVLISYLQSRINVNFKTFPRNMVRMIHCSSPQKGSINTPENDRGITLLTVLGKPFTRILTNRFTSWAERYNVYIEAQASFRSEMSTSDNIFVLHGIITHMVNQGKNCIVVS